VRRGGWFSSWCIFLNINHLASGASFFGQESLNGYNSFIQINNTSAMLRLLLITFSSTLILFNRVEGASSYSQNLIQRNTADSIIGDSIDVSFILQLSRGEFEEVLGRKLSKAERKEFRKYKRDALRQPYEGRRPGIAGLLIGLALLLGGLLVAGASNIAILGCEDDEDCAKPHENPKLAGLGLAVCGAIVSIVSLFAIANPDKVKAPQKDTTREKWSF
jgi:hypothetical protein